MTTVNAGANTSNFMYMQIVRDSTPIFRGDAAGSRPRRSGMYYDYDNTGMNATINVTHMDEPATTSATTYKIQIQCATTGNAYVNRSHRDTDGSGYDARLASSITVMEISG